MCSFKNKILPIIYDDIIDNCDDLEICEYCKLLVYLKYQQMLVGLFMEIVGIANVFLFPQPPSYYLNEPTDNPDGFLSV